MPDDSCSPRPEPGAALLRNVRLADGSRADVRLAGRTIAAVEPAAANRPRELGVALHELTGYLLLPTPVEPHAHIDRAFLGDRAGHADLGAGDLRAAVAAVRRLAATTSAEDVRARARVAVAAAVQRGVAAIRTHVDCHPSVVRRALPAVVALREELRPMVTIQVVAMAGRPITGRDGAAHRAALGEALAAGADLVGGAPGLDDDPAAAVAELASAARAAGCGMDLHLDETIDPSSTAVVELLAAGRAHGFAGSITASHLISLGQLPAGRAARIAAELAAADIAVVTLPHTSLQLQDRGLRTPTKRALTALAELHRAGVRVAAGSDNWRDPFNPFGDPDPLRTAALLGVTAHLSPAAAYRAVSDDGRAVLGLPPVRIRPGDPADLLAVRGDSLAEVLATCTPDRVVFRGGEVLVRTRVTTQWSDSQDRP